MRLFAALLGIWLVWLLWSQITVGMVFALAVIGGVVLACACFESQDFDSDHYFIEDDDDYC